MPYIKDDRRHDLRPMGWENRPADKPRNAGELNYVVTRAILDFLSARTRLDYQSINDVRGAVSGALVEFEDRIARPYEDLKIAQNGDVYPEWLLCQTRELR